jgi:hypothetical protein
MAPLHMLKLTMTSGKYKMYVRRILTVVLENANRISRVMNLEISFTCLVTTAAGKWIEIQILRLCIISGFCHEVDEICALLGCYTAYGGNFNLLVPSSSSNLGPIFKSVVLKSETVQIQISTANYCNIQYDWATNVITDRYGIKSARYSSS